MRTQFYFTLFILSLFLSSALNAQDGTLDKNFGTLGVKTLYASGTTADNLRSVAVQPDGKIVVGGVAKYPTNGTGHIYIARLDKNGNFDPNFGSGGIQSIAKGDSCNIQGLALTADGSIVFAGNAGSPTRATTGRLNSDGSVAVFPVGPYAADPTTASYNNVITSMSYNSANNSVLVGGNVQLTFSYMAALKFTTNGAFDASFNGSGKKYFGGPPTPPIASTLIYSFASLNLNDGSSLLACNLAYGGVWAVVKLKPNGSLDNTFGGGDGIFSYSADPSYGEPRSMLLLPDGKIMVCGGAQVGGGRFTIIRVNADGTLDTGFNAAQYTIGALSNCYYTSMVLQPDKKILASGFSTPSIGSIPTGVIARYKENGDLDSTFGLNGIVTLANNMTINASALSVSDKTLVLVGKSNGSNLMTVVKLKYEVQSFNILGKDIVSASTENTYTLHPYNAADNYTYTWTSNGTNILSANSAAGDSTTLFFKSTSPPGVITLTCTIKNASGTKTIKVVTKSITVRKELTLAELLTDPSCSPAQTTCNSNYISSLKIDKDLSLININNNCSTTGYYNFTAADDYDTLFVGDNYQATITKSSSEAVVTYAGVWIDLNNDGKMDDSKEYVGSSYSETGFNAIAINNLIIPSDAELGPKRLRIRIRSSGPFTIGEFCAVNEEEGETEDYLIVLNKYEGIKTPNFITPNGDGKNDFFVVRGVEKNVNNNLKVFNRIGDLVYDVNNYDNDWDGKDQGGTQLKPGTYYYVFSQKTADKEKDTVVKGFLEVKY